MSKQQIEFISGLSSLQPKHCGSVITIGSFDGVHLGHQQLLTQVKDKAKHLGLPSTVVIFEPQPNEYFQKQSAPARLMRLREKVDALSRCGVDRILCLKFDSHLRSLSAEAFVKKVIADGLGAQYLVVGDDFRFGCDRLGDYAFLQDAGKRYGFAVSDTSTHLMSAWRVSSTRVREALARADLDEAAKLLGTRYQNLGRVVYGKQLGRTLGFPTLNVALGRLSVPLQGVFAVGVKHAQKYYLGVANVGVRPTLEGDKKPILEVHILNETIHLYGEFIKVEYLFKLRDEVKFASIAQLTEQIQKDVDAASVYFKSIEPQKQE